MRKALTNVATIFISCKWTPEKEKPSNFQNNETFFDIVLSFHKTFLNVVFIFPESIFRLKLNSTRNSLLKQLALHMTI